MVADIKKNEHFYSAIEKYGWNNFSHEIIENNLKETEVNQREQYWIKFYNSTDPNYGYNHTSGGSMNMTYSEETKEKIRKSWTPERRLQQAERLKKLKEAHPEWVQKNIEKLNQVRPDVKGINNPMYGKNRSGINAGNKKKVICIETGQVFYTIIDAARWAGSEGLKSHISQVCKGKRKVSGKHPITGEPLHWKYIEE